MTMLAPPPDRSGKGNAFTLSQDTNNLWIIHGFRQFLQANVTTVPQSGYDLFLPHPLQIIHQSFYHPMPYIHNYESITVSTPKQQI
jgi:hypothetical protein